MKLLFVLSLSSLVWGSYCVANETGLVDGRIVGEFAEGEEVWLGFFAGPLNASSTPVREWKRIMTKEFSLKSREVTNTTMVAHRVGFVPVVMRVTSRVEKDGISLEFSKGVSLSGIVDAEDASEDVIEGTVSATLATRSSIPMPFDSFLSSSIDERGEFLISGLSTGIYDVSVVAPGYMPNTVEGVKVERDQEPHLYIKLAIANFLSGRIIDRKGTTVVGHLQVEVTPEQSVNTEVRFDPDNTFHVGPFATGTSVTLMARSSDGARSLPEETPVPQEDELVLKLAHWVHFTAMVRDIVTGNPLDEFTLHTYGRPDSSYPQTQANGRLDVDIPDHNVGAVAVSSPGYLTWDSGFIDVRSLQEYDLGPIELVPALTIRGRVTDSTTGEPIEGARITRSDGTYAIAIQRWINTTSAQTNGEGEFTLTGMPGSGGSVAVGKYEYDGKNIKIGDPDTYLEIELTPWGTGSISGEVVSVGGTPVEAIVTLGFGSGHYGRDTEEDGSFRFESYNDGTYELSAQSD